MTRSLITGAIWGAVIILMATMVITIRSMILKPAAVPPNPVVLPEPGQPVAVVKLMAVLPDGTRVYRVEGPEMIVPSVVAVTPQGQVSIR